MQNTFRRRGDQWVLVSEKYLRTGDRAEVRLRDGSVSVVVVGECLEEPNGVRCHSDYRHGDYVYAISHDT